MNGRLRRVAACGLRPPAATVRHAAARCRSPRCRPPRCCSPRCLLAVACGRLTLRGGGLRRRPAAAARRGLRPPWRRRPTALVFFSCARLRRGRSGLTMSCRFELPLCDACAARVRAFAQRGGRSRRRRPWRLPPPRAFVALPPASRQRSASVPPTLPPTLPPALPPALSRSPLTCRAWFASPAVHAHEMPVPAHKRRRMTVLR